jgi:hypothetical protein
VSTVVTQPGTRAGTFQLYYSASYDRWVFNRFSADVDAPVIARAKSTKPPVLGAWTHLLGVYDDQAKQIKLYVNGQLQETTSFATPWASSGKFQVGRMKAVGAYTDYFAGDIDQVQAWERAVFPYELPALVNMENPDTGQDQPDLLAKWAMDETSGAVAADSSGNGNSLTLQSGAAFTSTLDQDRERSLSFDGTTNGRATTSTMLDNSGSFTLAGWVNLSENSQLDDTSVGHSPTVFSHPGAQRNAFRLWYRQEVGQTVGDWNFGIYETDVLGGPAATVVSDEVNPPGGWVFVTAVYDSARQSAKLYITGTRQGDEDGALVKDTFQPSGPIMTGGSRRHDTGEWGNALPGLVDDLQIYAGVMSEAQIGELAATTEVPVPIE